MTRLGLESNALLDAARSGDEPTQADRERVRAAIASRLATGAAAGLGVATAAKASAAAATPAGLTAKALVTVAVVGVSAVSAVMVARTPPRPAAPVSVPALPAPIDIQARARMQPNGTENLPAPAATTSEETQAAVRSSARMQAGASSTRTAPPTGDVAAEVRLLSEAHAVMRGGDAQRALVLLEEHARRFPKGALGEERDVTRIAALCALGRTGEARDAADRFLRAAPLSPHAGLVRASCGGTPATPASPF